MESQGGAVSYERGAPIIPEEVGHLPALALGEGVHGWPNGLAEVLQVPRVLLSEGLGVMVGGVGTDRPAPGSG